MPSKNIQTLRNLTNGRIADATALAIAKDLEAEGYGDLLEELPKATDSQEMYLVLEKIFARHGISLFDLLDSGPSPGFDDVLEKVTICLGQFGTLGLDGEIWIVTDDYGNKEISVEMSDFVFGMQSKWAVAIQALLDEFNTGYKVIVTNRDRIESSAQIEGKVRKI